MHLRTSVRPRSQPNRNQPIVSTSAVLPSPVAAVSIGRAEWLDRSRALYHRCTPMRSEQPIEQRNGSNSRMSDGDSEYSAQDRDRRHPLATRQRPGRQSSKKRDGWPRCQLACLLADSQAGSLLGRNVPFPHCLRPTHQCCPPPPSHLLPLTLHPLDISSVLLSKPLPHPAGKREVRAARERPPTEAGLETWKWENGETLAAGRSSMGEDACQLRGQTENGSAYGDGSGRKQRTGRQTATGDRSPSCGAVGAGNCDNSGGGGGGGNSSSSTIRLANQARPR